MRIIKNKILIKLFYKYKFNGLFNNNEALFLAWLLSESGHDKYCVRYEPQYIYYDKGYDPLKQKISYGLFQIMGANLKAMGFLIGNLEHFLKDINMQFKYCRKYLRKCPSYDLNENLRWWNTGRVKPTEAGIEYVKQIKYLSRKFK